MDLTPPICATPNCIVTLHSRTAMARRGERTLAFTARFWRCDRCVDPDTGEPPFEFLDMRVMSANEQALAAAWREKFGENLPATGRPGRKTDAPRTERVAILLTPEELGRVDERRGKRSRSDFLREVISNGLRAR